MTGIINSDGIIQAVGYQYPQQLPNEITFDNYQFFKCIDLTHPELFISYEPYMPEWAEEQRFEADKEKGRNVINAYLLDNRKLDLTTAQSLQQLQKFSAIKALLEVGAIGSAVELITGTEVDEIFTQERKDRYINML